MSKRRNIRGTGPRRHELKTFHKLGNVAPETLADLRSLIGTYKHTDISTDGYAISSLIDYENTHGVKGDRYRQVLLQGKAPGDDADDDLNETRYSHWWSDRYPLGNTIHDVNKHFNRVCRFRLSELQPHSEIGWHIDTDTSVACRGQICLSEDDSDFFFKDRDGVHNLKMKPGEIWFINTGWNHSVQTHEDLRQVAVFTFLFEDLINKEDIRL